MRAFTLIEIIIAVAIILLFAGLAIPRYSVLDQETKLKGQGNKLAEVLELAKKKANSSELYNFSCTDFNGYRVTIGVDSFSLNFGCSGAYETIQLYSLENNISITTGTGDFDFLPGGFGTNITISSVRLKSAAINKCVDLSITSIGICPS